MDRVAGRAIGSPRETPATIQITPAKPRLLMGTEGRAGAKPAAGKLNPRVPEEEPSGTRKSRVLLRSDDWSDRPSNH